MDTPRRNIPKRLAAWAGLVALALMIPYVTKAPWTTGDYIFAGVVLFGLATAYEVVTKDMASLKHRVAVGFGVLVIVFLIIGWAASGP